MAFTVDTIHPNDAGQARVVSALAGEPMVNILTELPGLKFLCLGDTGMTTSTMSAVTSGGLSPPTLTLTGTPTGPIQLVVRCPLIGGAARGTAVFDWSADGGINWVTGVQANGSGVLVLTGTGITGTFAAANASNDNYWVAYSRISQWNDLSAAGNNLTRATAGSRPQFKALGGRARRVLHTDGSQWNLGKTGINLVQPFTVAFVGMIDAMTGFPAMFGDEAAGVTALYASGTQFRISAGSNLNATVASTFPFAPHLYVCVFDGANSAIYFDQNPVAAATGAAGAAGIADLRWLGDAIGPNAWVGTNSIALALDHHITAGELAKVQLAAYSVFGIQ